jgi:hypothetical protein
MANIHNKHFWNIYKINESYYINYFCSYIKESKPGQGNNGYEKISASHRRFLHFSPGIDYNCG